MDERTTALRTLEATPAILASLLAAAPDATIARTGGDAWNVADVVAHLV